MTKKTKLLRITTVPISLNILLKGQLDYVNSNGFEVHAASADGLEVDELVKREGVPHYTIPFTRKITPFKDLYCIWRLIILIKRLQPEIVHTHTPKAGLIGMISARLCGVPHRLHTVAGMPLMESTGLVKRTLILTEKITYACASRVYPNSVQLKKYITDHIRGFDEKLKVLAKGSSNGIDLNFFKDHIELRHRADNLKKDLQLNGSVVFSFMGRIVRDKGIHELIEAFCKLKKTLPDIKLLLIGPHEKELDPLDAATESVINGDPDIIPLGFQDDVRPYLLMSDVFVFPSYREGFPNVLLQASALGVPSIASNINGCNEIITHQTNGLLVPAKNIDELKSAMNALAVDKNLRMAYGSKARDHVSLNYDQQYVWKALLNEYKSLSFPD